MRFLNGLAPASDTVRRPDFEASLARLRTTPTLTEAQVRDMERKRESRKYAAAYADFARQAGPRVARCRFENFVTRSHYQMQVLRALQEWSPGGGIVLYGPVGTGKDHLAFASVARLLHREPNNVARWENGRELMGKARDRISNDESEVELVASLRSPDVLVISDPLPPVGDLTAYQTDLLYRIMEARYGGDKPTVVTVNVGGDEEADRRLGAATWDRMCDQSLKIFCNWESYRKPTKELRP